MTLENRVRLRTSGIGSPLASPPKPVLVETDEQHRAGEELRLHAQPLQLITDTIPAMIWRVRNDGSLEYGNKRLLDYLGQTMNEISGESWFALVHPDDVERVREQWKGTIKSKSACDITFRVRRADGSYRWLQAVGQRRCDNNGDTLDWYGQFIDIHGQLETEEALREMQSRLSQASRIAALAELSASIAHEISQPLASMVNYGHACLGWLNAESPNIERARIAVDRIISDGEHAAEVVQRTRALFRQAVPTKTLIDINETIRQVYRLMVAETRSKSIVFEMDLALQAPLICADSVQLQQLLINLVHNGIDAMKSVPIRQRYISIVSRSYADGIAVDVRDRGTGIAAPEKIFESFYTTKSEGMGVGLSICRSIVTAHNGSLTIVENDGPGSTFRFTLPVNRHQPQC
jgi:PAS domain S-box-containing protein